MGDPTETTSLVLGLLKPGVAALAALVLGACGGGGGRPGDCSASTQTCARIGDGGSGSGGDDTSTPTNTGGLWRGTTSNGRTAYALTLSDGQAWVIYTASGSTTVIGGAAQGSFTANGNVLTATNARDFNFEGLGINNATITASVQTKQSIAGTVSYTTGGSVVTFSGTYDARFENIPSSAAVAGTYRGQAVVLGGSDTATIQIGTGGSISGTTQLGCNFSGSALPRSDGNVYNLTMQFLGGNCSNGNSTVTGVAFFDSATGQAIGTALNAERTNGFLFLGTKQ